MRKLAGLALFLCLCFALLFLASAGIRFMAIRGGWTADGGRPAFAVFGEAARWAVSFTLYGVILLGLWYSFYKGIFTPAAMLCVGILSLAFSFGAGTALRNTENLRTAGPILSPHSPGGPGLIVAGSPRPSSPVTVLLEGPAATDGARVIADPGRPLRYQERAAGKGPGAGAAAFDSGAPWFLKSAAIDLRLNGEELRRRLEGGLLPFFTYAGALVFLLVSLGFILRFSHWPLAGLIAGIMVFRGVLALETFFNTPEMGDVFASFLRIRMPFSPAVPVVFCAAGILCCLYGFLTYLAKKRSGYAD